MRKFMKSEEIIMLFDKKTMKLISDYKKVQKYLLDGTPVYLVQMDATLLELTEATDWKLVFFHNLKGGNYAIYRKKFTIGTFAKNINIGGWSFAVSHSEKGGEC